MYKSLKIKGFTLVELLVVISIVGLLAGLAVPAINSGLKKAKSGACLSNLRQIGIATLAYTAENSFYFPEAGSGNSPGWATNIAAFMSIDTKSKKSVFVCPGCEKAVQDAGTGQVALTYGVNGRLMPNNQPATNRVSNVPRATEVILAADVCQDPGNKGWSPFCIESPAVFQPAGGAGRGGSVPMETPISTATDSDTGNNKWIRYRHSGKANVVMVDGHAESFKKGTILNKHAVFEQ